MSGSSNPRPGKNLLNLRFKQRDEPYFANAEAPPEIAAVFTKFIIFGHYCWSYAILLMNNIYFAIQYYKPKLILYW